jgi:hypothetical protein
MLEIDAREGGGACVRARFRARTARRQKQPRLMTGLWCSSWGWWVSAPGTRTGTSDRRRRAVVAVAAAVPRGHPSGAT